MNTRMQTIHVYTKEHWRTIEEENDLNIFNYLWDHNVTKLHTDIDQPTIPGVNISDRKRNSYSTANLVKEVHAKYKQVMSLKISESNKNTVKWQAQDIIAALMYSVINDLPPDRKTINISNQWFDACEKLINLAED